MLVAAERERTCSKQAASHTEACADPQRSTNSISFYQPDLSIPLIQSFEFFGLTKSLKRACRSAEFLVAY